MIYELTTAPQLNKDLSDSYAQFLSASNTAISVLVNEFRRKKDAWESAEVTHRQEGEIDFSRIYNYKTSNDIFTSLAVKRKGKGHGIIILIDASSSMSNVFPSVIKQAIIVAKFAQKVKIPYEIYLTGTRIDHESKNVTNKFQNVVNISRMAIVMIASSDGPLDMQNKQLFAAWAFTSGVIIFPEVNGHIGKDKNQKLTELSKQYQLVGYTLLHEAIFALSQVTREFKVRKNIENVSTLVLTDGGDNMGFSVVDGSQTDDSIFTSTSTYGMKSTGLTTNLDELSRMYITDNNTRKTYSVCDLLSKDVLSDVGVMNGISVMTSMVVGYYRAVTGSKLCAIHLLSSQSMIQGFYQFSGIYNSKIKNEYALERAIKDDYSIYEGLLGYDTVSIVKNETIKKQALTRSELKQSIDKATTLGERGGLSSDSMANMVFNSIVDNQKSGVILARNIADLICRDFEVIKKNRKVWYEMA